MSNHCITGFRKVKNNAKISAIVAHNLRLQEHLSRLEGIDQNRTMHNQVLKNTFNIREIPELSKSLSDFYASKNIKVHKDNVLAIDILITTSPDFWGDWKNQIDTPQFQKKLTAWRDVQMKFIEDKFGLDACKFAVLHLDETTPHIHFFVTPEETKEVKYKNRYGASTIQKTVLNNKRFDPKFFVEFVNDLAKVNEKFGLVRGKENSKLKNSPLKNLKKVLYDEIENTKKLASRYSKAINAEEKDASLIDKLTKENLDLRKKLAIATEKHSQQLLDIKIQNKEILSTDELDLLGL